MPYCQRDPFTSNNFIIISSTSTTSIVIIETWILFIDIDNLVITDTMHKISVHIIFKY